MIIAFYTKLAKSIVATVDGKTETYYLPRNEWCIIDKVTETSQINNFGRLAKDEGVQLYYGAWKQDPPFGSGTKLSIVVTGSRRYEKIFSALLQTYPDAMLEMAADANKDRVILNADDILNVFGNRILEINSGLVDAKAKGGDTYASYLSGLTSMITKAKLNYISAQLGKLENYSNINFDASKFEAISTRIADNKTIIAALSGVTR